MDGINWGGLNNGANPFASFTQGMERGAEMREARAQRDREATRRQAINLFATDPRGAEAGLMAVGDIETAEALRKRREGAATDERRAKVGGMVGQKDYAGAQAEAIAGGDFDMAKSIAGLDEAQRKAAREHAEDLGGFAMGLKTVPYEQRKAIIAQVRPLLLQRGFNEQQIDGFDPSDANITALATSAMDLKTALDEANRQRDDARADAQAEERRRHNSALERQGKDRLGIARDANARGWAAHKARVAAGGYGTPGVGGVVADDDVEIDP